MHLAIIFQLTGILLILFSFTFLTPILVALLYNETTAPEFATAFLITAVSGLALWIPFSRSPENFEAATVFWSQLCFILD